MARLKPLAILFLTLLLISPVLAADPITLKPKDNEVNMYDVYLKDGESRIGVFSGTVWENEIGKMMLNGVFSSTYEKKGDNGKVNVKRDVEIASPEIRVGLHKYDNGQEIALFSTDLGGAYIDKHLVRAGEDGTVRLAVKDDRESWIDVKGEAIILPNGEEGGFPEIKIKDLYSIDTLKLKDENFYLNGLPLGTEDGSYDGSSVVSAATTSVFLRSDQKTRFKIINNDAVVPTVKVYVYKGTAWIQQASREAIFVVHSRPEAKLRYALPSNEVYPFLVDSGVVKFRWFPASSGFFEEDILNPNPYSTVDIYMRGSSFYKPEGGLVENWKGLLSSGEMEIKATLKDIDVGGKSLPTVLKIGRSNLGGLKKIYYDKMAVGDDSKLQLRKPDIGGKLLFSKKGVDYSPKSGLDIFSFETNFAAQLLGKDGKYHEYVCDWEKRECTYDGVPVGKSTKPNLKECSKDSDCGSGQFCAAYKDWTCLAPGNCQFLDYTKYCMQDSKCNSLVKGSSGKGEILFMGEGFSSEIELRDTVNTLVNNVLFNTKPFNNPAYKKKISASYINLENFPKDSEGLPFLNSVFSYYDKCPSADFFVILSNKPEWYYWSQATGEGKGAAAKVWVGGGITEEDKKLFLHEFGHSFADLADEYYDYDPLADVGGWPNFPNCATTAEEAREWWSEAGMSSSEIEGSLKYRGCGGFCSNKKQCKKYYRPSKNSIMNDYTMAGGDKFNKPSIYAIEKVLKGI